MSNFLRATAIHDFVIGSFIKNTDGLELTTGVPSGQVTKDGVLSALSGNITYNGAEWVIDTITADEMDGLILGFKFSLATCFPIHYTIKTSISDNLIINPVAVTVSPGAVSSSDLTAYYKASYSFLFTIIDGNGDAVVLTGKSISFIVYTDYLNPLYSLTTGLGNISINSNQVTVESNDTNTQSPGRYKFVLRNETDDTVLATGTLTILAVAGD